METSEEGEENHKCVLQGREQWINDLRYWLADIYIRTDDDYSPFRFINRVSFVNIHHLFVLIFHDRKVSASDNEGDAQDPYTIDELVSAFDPYLKEKLYVQLEEMDFGELHFDEKKKKKYFYFNSANIEKYKIQLFDTNTFIILFDLKLKRKFRKGKILAGSEPIIKFEPLAKGQERWQFYHDLFLPFDGSPPRMSLEYDLEKHFHDLSHDRKLVQAKQDSPKVMKDLDTKLYVSLGMKRIIKMIDAEYLRLAKSPLLKSFVQEDLDAYRIPANIFFVCKAFNREDKRFHDHYHYTPFFIMGEQAKDIKRQLKKMGGQIVTKNQQQLRREDFIAYPNQEYDDLFWERLKDKNEIEEIIRDINFGWPNYVRIFPENNLMSGSTTIIQDPFTNGSIGWVDAKGLSKKKKLKAYKKLVSLHYILQLGMPRVMAKDDKGNEFVKKPVDAQNLTIVANSIRVNGAVWMSSFYLRENIEGDPENKDCNEISGLLNQKVFDKSIFIQQSLIKETEKRIRYKSQEGFVKLLSDIIRSTSIQQDDNDDELLNSLVSKINLRMKALCRVYPYDHFFIETIGEQSNIKLKFKENPYFDRLSGRSYMNKEEVMQRLKDQLQLAQLG